MCVYIVNKMGRENLVSTTLSTVAVVGLPTLATS